MTRRFPSSRPGDDRFDELTENPALEALIADARARPVEADRGPTLETALAVFRVAAAPPTVDAEPARADRPTRRHRFVRAVAATTLATKVLLGVATAAALGGIGVAVAETVQHISPSAPVTTAPATTPPPSEAPTGGGSDAPPSGSSPSTSASPSVSPTSTVTDTASRGASGTSSPTGSASSSGSQTSTGAGATRSPSSSPSSASPQVATPSASSDDTGDR